MEYGEGEFTMKKYTKPTIITLRLAITEKIAVACPIPEPDGPSIQDNCDLVGALPPSLPNDLS